MNDKSSSTIVEIPIDKIEVNPYQPRKVFNEESIKELSDSIVAHGLLQPVNVREIQNDKYQLVIGERRFRATKLAGKDKIPAIITQLSNSESAVVALVENLQREDLNYLEEALGYIELSKKHRLTQKEIAETIGKSQSTISNKIRLLKLSPEVQEALYDNKLSERHARALLKLDSYSDQLMIIDQVAKQSLNVKQTERLIDLHLKKKEIEHKDTSNQKVKSYINYKIYVNTIKNAYDDLVNAGVNVEFQESDHEDYVELKVKIPKK